MGKRIFAVPFLFAAWTVSCASANGLDTQKNWANQLEVDLASVTKKTLASQELDRLIEVKDGSVLFVTTQVPEELKKVSDLQIYGRFEDREVPFFPLPEKGDGFYGALIGISYDTPPGTQEISVSVRSALNPPSENDRKISFEVVAGGYASEKLTVDSEKASPSKPRNLARIEKERSLTRGIYSKITPERYWRKKFKKPMKSAMTSTFGRRRVFNGVTKSFHPGVDFRARVGDKIFAPAPGKVVLARNLFFTGNTIILDHGYGLFSIYAHLSKFIKHVGDPVKSGDWIAKSGATGRVSGPHLHWGVVIGGVKVNPMDLTEGVW